MLLRALFALSVLVAAPGLAQTPEAPWAPGGESRGEDLRIQLFTFSPGDELISWWGHTALVVQDDRLHQARLYNYGMFSFDNAMLLKFATGRLEFWVGEASVPWTIRAYSSHGRTIHLQELALSPADRLKAAQGLAVSIRPANRGYLYDHYRDNCSTRPRDVIDMALNGRLKAATSGPGRMTLRQHTQRYTQVNPAISVFLDFMMNDSIDKPLTMAEEAFLPDELERQLDALSPSAVAQKVIVHDAHRPPVPEQFPHYELTLLFIGFGVAALLLLTGHWAGGGSKAGRIVFGLEQAFIGLVVGLPGTVLLLMWLLTNHWVTFHNENLLMANPLTLMLVPWGIGWAAGSKKAVSRAAFAWRILGGLAVLALAAKLVPLFDQDNRRSLALLVPSLLAGAFAAIRAGRR